MVKVLQMAASGAYVFLNVASVLEGWSCILQLHLRFRRIQSLLPPRCHRSVPIQHPLKDAQQSSPELGIQVHKRHHEPCVASEGKSSNARHHEVLQVSGHIVVTLFLKGAKKKELIMLVKKPTTKLDLKAFGLASEVSVKGNAVRMADAKSLQAALDMQTDFVSPLALVNALDKGVKLHRVLFDASLQDGESLWCLPPMVNTESWGMSLLDVVKFAQGCRQPEVNLIELEPGSAARALQPRAAPSSEPDTAALQVRLIGSGKSATDGGKWKVQIGSMLGSSSAAAVKQARSVRVSKLANGKPTGPKQAWWKGQPLMSNLVVDKLAELKVSSDDQQANTPEEEQASWCTTLFVKCKKTKKLFMVTARPGVKLDLKKIAKQVGAKELRMADEKSKTFLNLPSEQCGGCLTAMSVLGDAEKKVTSVLDRGILDMAVDCRMCSGCADFRNHAQHHISSVPPAVLVKMLEGCGHEPKIVDI